MELMQFAYKIDENFDELETIIVLDHPLQVGKKCRYSLSTEVYCATFGQL